ncbi:hypothetical protein D9M71_149000 [compost metagenome]
MFMKNGASAPRGLLRPEKVRWLYYVVFEWQAWHVLLTEPFLYLGDAYYAERVICCSGTKISLYPVSGVSEAIYRVCQRNASQWRTRRLP